MSFKKNKYTVIRQAISKDLASFVANYFSMQKQLLRNIEANNAANKMTPALVLLIYQLFSIVILLEPLDPNVNILVINISSKQPVFSSRKGST